MFWYDRQGLLPGDEFRQRIEDEIDRADVALLLVSQGFLNSDFIESVELPRIQARAERGELAVVPLLAGPCAWDQVEFLGGRQMMPGKPTPLIDYIESDRQWEHMREEVLQAIQTRIQHLRAGPVHQSGATKGPRVVQPPVSNARRWSLAAVLLALVVALGLGLTHLTRELRALRVGSSPDLQDGTSASRQSRPARETDGALPEPRPPSSGQMPSVLVEEWTGKAKSKLSTAAFAQEEVIVKSAMAKTFAYETGKPCCGAIVQTLFKSRSRETLADLRRFVEEGRRAAVFVSSQSAENNGDLQELFGLSVIHEYGILGRPGGTEDPARQGGRPLLDGSAYAPLFEGLTLAGPAVTPTHLRNGTPTRWRESGISCHLVPVGEGWVPTHFDTKSEICLSAWRRMGQGEVLFLVAFEAGSFPETFLEDRDIEAVDNMEAARRIIRWLAGKTEYPGAPRPDQYRQ